jgi:hypothetical protein
MTDKEALFEQMCRDALPVMREWYAVTHKLNGKFMEAWRAGCLDDLWAMFKERYPDLWLVYFIRARGMGDIKIGKTNHVRQRVKSLFSSCSRGVDLIACHPAKIEDETELHRDFERHRLCGEWFRPGDEILSHLRMIGVDPATFSNVVPAHHFRRYPERLQ